MKAVDPLEHELDSSELPCGCRKLKLDPLKKQSQVSFLKIYLLHIQYSAYIPEEGTRLIYRWSGPLEEQSVLFTSLQPLYSGFLRQGFQIALYIRLPWNSRFACL